MSSAAPRRPFYAEGDRGANGSSVPATMSTTTSSTPVHRPTTAPSLPTSSSATASSSAAPSRRLSQLSGATLNYQAASLTVLVNEATQQNITNSELESRRSKIYAFAIKDIQSSENVANAIRRQLKASTHEVVLLNTLALLDFVMRNCLHFYKKVANDKFYTVLWGLANVTKPATSILKKTVSFRKPAATKSNISPSGQSAIAERAAILVRAWALHFQLLYKGDINTKADRWALFIIDFFSAKAGKGYKFPQVPDSNSPWIFDPAVSPQFQSDQQKQMQQAAVSAVLSSSASKLPHSSSATASSSNTIEPPLPSSVAEIQSTATLLQSMLKETRDFEALKSDDIIRELIQRSRFYATSMDKFAATLDSDQDLATAIELSAIIGKSVADYDRAFQLSKWPLDNHHPSKQSPSPSSHPKQSTSPSPQSHPYIRRQQQQQQQTQPHCIPPPAHNQMYPLPHYPAMFYNGPEPLYTHPPPQSAPPLSQHLYPAQPPQPPLGSSPQLPNAPSPFQIPPSAYNTYVEHTEHSPPADGDMDRETSAKVKDRDKEKLKEKKSKLKSKQSSDPVESYAHSYNRQLSHSSSSSQSQTQDQDQDLIEPSIHKSKKKTKHPEDDPPINNSDHSTPSSKKKTKNPAPILATASPLDEATRDSSEQIRDSDEPSKHKSKKKIKEPTLALDEKSRDSSEQSREPEESSKQKTKKKTTQEPTQDEDLGNEFEAVQASDDPSAQKKHRIKKKKYKSLASNMKDQTPDSTLISRQNSAPATNPVSDELNVKEEAARLGIPSTVPVTNVVSGDSDDPFAAFGGNFLQPMPPPQENLSPPSEENADADDSLPQSMYNMQMNDPNFYAQKFAPSQGRSIDPAILNAAFQMFQDQLGQQLRMQQEQLRILQEQHIQQQLQLQEQMRESQNRREAEQFLLYQQELQRQKLIQQYRHQWLYQQQAQAQFDNYNSANMRTYYSEPRHPGANMYENYNPQLPMMHQPHYPPQMNVDPRVLEFLAQQSHLHHQQPVAPPQGVHQSQSNFPNNVNMYNIQDMMNSSNPYATFNPALLESYRNAMAAGQIPVPSEDVPQQDPLLPKDPLHFYSTVRNAPIPPAAKPSVTAEEIGKKSEK